MKKKLFLLVPAMLFALVACDGNNSSTSTSTSGNTSTSTSNSTSGDTKEYISLKALKSIFESYTAVGTYTYAQRVGFTNSGNTFNLTTRYQVGGLEMGISYNGTSINRQYVNNDGYVAQWHHDVDNVVRLQNLTTTSGAKAVWSLDNDFESVVSVKQFVKQSDGSYLVTNDDTKTAIASAMAIGMIQLGAYDPDNQTIDTMKVQVSDDKIVGISFETAEYISSSVRYKDTASFVLSGQGTTVVECELKAYDTYPEASLLKEAFEKVGSKAVAIIDTKNTYTTGTVSKSQNYTQKVYMSDTLYYSNYEHTNSTTGAKYTQGIAHSDAVNGTVIFTADTTGKLTPTNAYQGLELSNTLYGLRLTSIAPEMFEYKNGKYVTRSEADAATVGAYLLQDGSEEYVTEISITLDSDKNITVSYDYTARASTATLISKNTMTYASYDDSELSFLDFAGMEAQLEKAKGIDANMVASWSNGTLNVEISQFVVMVDGFVLTISETSEGVIKGTYVNNSSETVNVTLTLVPATETSSAKVNVSLNDGEATSLLKAIELNTTYVSTKFPMEYLKQFLGAANANINIPELTGTRFEFMQVSKDGYYPYFAIAVDGKEAGVEYAQVLKLAGWTVSMSTDGSSYTCYDPSNSITVVIMINSDSNGEYTLVAYFNQALSQQ